MTPRAFGSGSSRRVHSQGSESNNRYCSVEVPSSVPNSEVTGAAGVSFSWTPNGGGHGTSGV